MRVLTGDQMETTINVGFACNFLRQGMKQVPINLDSPDLKTLAKIVNKDVISKDLQGRVPHPITQGTNQLVSSARSEATVLTSYEKSSQSNIISSWATGLNSFVPNRSHVWQFSFTHTVETNGPLQYGCRELDTVLQLFIPNGQYHAPHVGRPFAGRPLYALITFGFGGSPLRRSLPQVSQQGIAFISILFTTNPSLIRWLGELWEIKSCKSGLMRAFQTVHVHIEEDKFQNCFSPCSGSPINILENYNPSAQTSLRANELPDSVVANLFAPTRGKVNFHQHDSSIECLMNLPSETQIQKPASAVQSPLPTDRKKEAVQLAEEGQLWVFALILAHELGEQFYINAVKKVATSHLGASLPLPTLFLLIAKKPEDVFSTNIMRGVGLPESVHMSPPTVQ
ncbi:hypothetical protein Nepgr_016565 [Nepenthes gracilis]|uniref:Sec16 Sec23-binding domain-containing protein n=1 Tax=Nepenthes gracilis TaxID=150966 RepID=A0AAD3SPX9_NEPGR|nr:hypothetical protein Nepgr_016565 [Nepenthes gracilis]